MPIDFSQFVFRPPALQKWGLGSGLDAIIEGNRERARLAQNESQYARTRRDSQSTNAATFARDQANTAYDTSKGKYDKQMKAIADARAAAQSGHEDSARALIPTILALGGEARQNPDGTFYFKEGSAPARGAPDFAGAREQIYGPSQARASAPFQVPGFGADGKRNPFEPPAVAGASAAALPSNTGVQNQGPAPAGALPSQSSTQSPAPPGAAADPPPGAARSVAPPGAVWLPPGVDPGPQPTTTVEPGAPSQPGAPPAPPADTTVAPPAGATPPPSSATQAAQQGQSAAPQPTGPNPFNPPALDPYTIDPRKVRAGNQERLQDYMEGVRLAMPSRFAPRLEAINKYVSSLGLPPDEALKLVQPMYNEIFAMARAELTAEGQAGRLEQMGAHQQSIRDDKSRQFAVARINKLVDSDSLKETKKKLTAGREAYKYIPDAHRNGNSANALIETIYRMKNTGVMTDKDFERSRDGIQSLWGKIKKGLLNGLIHPGGGFDPTTVADLKELIDTAMAANRETMGIARDSLYRAYQAAPNDIEREEFERAIRSFLPEEYLPDEFVEPWMERARQGGGVPMVEDEQAAMKRMAAEEGGVVDNVGVAPVPAGRHPSRSTERPNPPRKPPEKKRIIDTKPVDQMTNEDMDAAIKELEEEARQNKGK